MRRIVGLLEAFSGQGPEGIYWSIINNNVTGVESIVAVNDGDYLFVENGQGGIEREGYVKLRLDTNLEPYPYSDNQHHQQRVNQCTVHGLQDNIDANVWLEWFASNRPAVLIRGIVSND